MSNEQDLNIARQVRRALQFFAQTLPEDKALEVGDLYPAWEPGVAYEPMTIVKHGTHPDGKPKLYQVMQAHTSQSNWEPGTGTEALYKGVGFTDEGVAVWVQPQGAHDAYKQGDEVSHNGVIWVSSINGNVWEPGVYGWTQKP